MAKRNDDAHDIAGLLFWVTEQARMGCDRAAEENDMTGAQVRALLSLDEPSPMSSLAGHMGCDASNVTGIADRLEARGLIRRETGTDRRIKLLALTPEGEKVRDQVRKRLSETSPAGSLSDAERRTLKELLVKMSESKEQPTPDHQPG
ncbi:MAG TPA: MarR family transcriptional regulator [Actinomycetota bacterium]|jgi:DNA-binding MarR family transcriptional regulator|nr:MarR family transcriptional regulator [Actinomycetota bacterium]